MRTGKKKILIGSTDKCGTGVNVQTHLAAMHHEDNYMIRFLKLIKAAEEKLACVREDVKTRAAEIIRSAEFAIKVKDVTFAERTDGGASMLEANLKM